MLMQRRRPLLFIIITLLALIIAVFISGSLSAPEPAEETPARFADGDLVSLRGELVCLPHRDVAPGQPVTLECAYGFKDESGTYYAVEDATEDYSLIANVPMNEQVQIEGTYRPNPDTKYQQSGTIEAAAITR